MKSRSTRSAACLISVLVLALSSIASADVDQLQKTFVQPPDDARMMVRWWWFGPAVTHERLEKEMILMKEGGIGGFEVQPTYPLALDDEKPGFKNVKFMSPEFLDALKFTAAKAKELGLRMDLTLGSGWPYGGPMFSEKESTGALVTQVVAVPEGQKTVAVPQLPASQELMGAFIAPANSGIGGRGRGGRGGNEPNVSALKQATIIEGQIQIPADAPSPAEIVLFISGQTGSGGTRGMQVKRPAFGAEGPVIDHFSPAVIEKFIKEIAEPEIAACGPNPPYAIFCDSLEVSGENWTPNILAEFKKRRGYDLAPLLPALIGNLGPKTADIRHDWLMTCTELFNDYFNTRFQKLAHDHNTRYRIQGYGSPPAALYSYAFADLPEGEGFQWHGFSTTRWASSASHMLGRPVTSSETFTWLHQAVFLAAPLDIKAEANLHFLEGVNQIICHGWPYNPEGSEYPGWSFYAAAVFNDKNPWWLVMPDVTKYLQRCCSVLRQGTPANDVALFLPNSDAWANRATSISGAMQNTVSNATRALLDAGYGVDYFDDQLLSMRGKVDGNSLSFGDAKYRVVVLPYVERIQPATMKKLEDFAKAGGIVLALGNAPQLAPGYLTGEKDSPIVREISQSLFKDSSTLVKTEAELGAAIAKKLAPDVALSTEPGEIGFIHRHTDGGEVYFLANTTNQPKKVKATFRVEGMHAEIWEPMSGSVYGASFEKAPGASSMEINLDAYDSTIVAFTNRSIPPAPPAMPMVTLPPLLDLSTGWLVKFGNDGAFAEMDTLKSWTDSETTKGFSGVATYHRTINLDPMMAKEGVTMTLTFGTAKPLNSGGGRGGNGYRTELDPPVHEAAVVYLNDKRIGSLWSPPYKLDVTGVIHAGSNEIRIEVGNLAINYMAAHGYPKYDLAGIRRVYGNRFDPQGLNLVQPLPSGLFGPIQLVAGAGAK